MAARKREYVRRGRPLAWADVEPHFRTYLVIHRPPRKPSTARTYAQNVWQFVKWCNSHKIDYIHAEPVSVTRFLADSFDLKAHNSVALSLVSLRAFFAFCVDQSWRASNPCKDLAVQWEEPAPRRPLVQREIMALMAACRSQRDKDMLSIGLDCGLRVSEIVSLRESQIDFEKGLLFFRGKGGRIGWAAPSPALMQRLHYYCGRKDGVIWWTRDGRPLSVKRAQRNMEEIARRAGIKAHWHKLRTTFANVAIEAGVPLEDLQVLMRHKDISTTKHYAGAAINERARRAVQRLHDARSYTDDGLMEAGA